MKINNYSSVKTLSVYGWNEDPTPRRESFELEINANASAPSRATVLKLLLRRMESHKFKFDSGAYRINVEAVGDEPRSLADVLRTVP